MKRSRDVMNDSEVRDQVAGMVDATADVSDEANSLLDSADDLVAQEASDAKIGELQRELTTERDKHLRLAAEFDNFRRRNLKEKMEAEARGQAELARMILDPLDDIARFAHVDPAVTESKTVVEGVEMVEKKLDKALRGAGLEPVNPVNERFDPALHEAVGTETADSADLDGTVARVYQLGYTFKGQLLRPARVVVRQHHD
ncbi:MAG TPA: nucleotide exchange factor GrpE [Gemmatimonadaceae bacterium]|nr:nucleotide exchange factor GrpE [Gemmatimonadaceae bacterium]